MDLETAATYDLVVCMGAAGLAAELRYETEAMRLSVSEDGRVDGVVVRGRDGLLRRLGARAVVIASGGFEGSEEMLTQYLGERACDLCVIAPGPDRNRGEGIRMAMEIGADTAGQFVMFHAEPVDPRASKPDLMAHPNAAARTDPLAVEAFAKEGVDPSRIVVARASGAFLGCDRFGIEHFNPPERRVETLVALVAEGYAEHITCPTTPPASTTSWSATRSSPTRSPTTCSCTGRPARPARGRGGAGAGRRHDDREPAAVLLPGELS